MSDRYAGDGLSEVERTARNATDSQRTRRHRPGIIELAAAVLIVNGVIGLVSIVIATVRSAGGVDPFIGIGVAINVATIMIGLAVRTGHFWILAINYVAVLGFLDLLGALGGGTSPISFMLALADFFVLVVLLVNRAWFEPPAPDASEE